MENLRPTEASQIFKRLYTRKSTLFPELKKKSELCREYCKILGASLDKAQPGQNEYKQLNFDKKCTVSKHRAQLILDLYCQHINEIESSLNKTVFTEEELLNTPGLHRFNGECISSGCHSTGKIMLKMDELYQAIQKPIANNKTQKVDNSIFRTQQPHSKKRQQHATQIALYKTNPQAIIYSFILITAACLLALYLSGVIIIGPITINEGYTQEQHTAILKQREMDLTKQLTAMYKSIQIDNNKNQSMISILREKLDKTQNELSSTQNITASYHKQLVFLQDRNDYLESIKNQISEETYNNAHQAFMLGNTSTAYQLYENFKQQSNRTIQQVALANFEQAVINEDRLQYHKAYQLYQRAAQLQSDNSKYNKNAGLLAFSLGQFNTAMEYYKKALASNLKTYGDKHPDVAHRLVNLGAAKHYKGEQRQALETLEKALVILLDQFDKDHKLLAICWKNLRQVWKSLGDYKQSQQYLEKALTIFKSKLDSKHRLIQSTKNILSLPNSK